MRNLVLILMIIFFTATSSFAQNGQMCTMQTQGCYQQVSPTVSGPMQPTSPADGIYYTEQHSQMYFDHAPVTAPRYACGTMARLPHDKLLRMREIPIWLPSQTVFLDKYFLMDHGWKFVGNTPMVPTTDIPTTVLQKRTTPFFSADWLNDFLKFLAYLAAIACVVGILYMILRSHNNSANKEIFAHNLAVIKALDEAGGGDSKLDANGVKMDVMVHKQDKKVVLVHRTNINFTVPPKAEGPKKDEKKESQ